MRAVITGATGLIGRQLLTHFTDAVVLSRNPERARERLGDVEVHAWLPAAEPAPVEALRGADVVFNLAGEPVAGGRWSAERKQRIRDSRVIGTRNLVAGIAQLETRPKVLVSGSAVGYYGDRGDEELDERSSPGRDFLADVCVRWEAEAMAAQQLGLRVVCVRTGIVLASGGGALTKMLTPFKMGAGGKLGSGRQWMPWIHIDDMVAILLQASLDDSLSGAINATAPSPVTNAQFTAALAQVLHRPALLPVPKTMLRLTFGEMADIMLASQRVFPKAALEAGVHFEYTELAKALKAAVTGER